MNLVWRIKVDDKILAVFVYLDSLEEEYKVFYLKTFINAHDSLKNDNAGWFRTSFTANY